MAASSSGRRVASSKYSIVLRILPERLRRPADAGAQLSGTAESLAWRCTRTSQPPRICSCSTPPMPPLAALRRAGAAPVQRATDARRRTTSAAWPADDSHGSRCQPAAPWLAAERVLISDWFQQFNSHSMGSIAFGSDGALYASGGEASSWEFVDYGQSGDPPNPNGDPPVPVGGRQTSPTAEGGALRAQDLCTEGDPVGLSGSVIRVNADTGAAMPDNPLSCTPIPMRVASLCTGCGIPSGSPCGRARASCGSATLAGASTEEINIVPDPAARRLR